MSGAVFETADGPFVITKQIGKGKSAYSYLIERAGERRVLKRMHHEAVPYYTFAGSKLAPEVDAFHRLRDLGIRVPHLIEADGEREFLIKEYVEGSLAAHLIAAGRVADAVFGQLFAMARTLAASGLNIDYFPTNFVIDAAGMLTYIDYEINPYLPQWDLLAWGIWYWVNSDGMRRFLATGDGAALNRDPAAGLPITAGLESEVARLAAKFAPRVVADDS